MPLLPAFLQAIFFLSSSTNHSSPEPSPKGNNKSMKRQGSKLAMIFHVTGNTKRERVNSKHEEDVVAPYDEDNGDFNNGYKGREGASVGRKTPKGEDVEFTYEDKRRSKNLTFRSADDDTGSTNEDKRKSKNMSKVPSKLKLMFNKSERPHLVAMTDAMARIETLIQMEKGKKKLVEELLVLKGGYSVMVRFCSAVEKFDAVGDDKERATLGQSLVDMFLKDGCKFAIALTEARKQAIMDGHFNQLLDAKREVLEELSKNAEVMRIVDFVETFDFQ